MNKTDINRNRRFGVNLLLAAMAMAAITAAPRAANAQALTLTNVNFDADRRLSGATCTGWTRTSGNGIFHGTSYGLKPDTGPNQVLLNTRDGNGIGTEFTSDVLSGRFVHGTTYALDYKFAVRNGKIPLPAAHDLRVEIVGSSDGVLATSGDLAPRITDIDTYFSGSLIWDSTGTAAQDLTVVLKASGNQNQTFGFDSLDLGIVRDTGGTTYHVDSNGGSDDQKGTSAESAWKSLANLNRTALKPGDKILLKAGCTFAGLLQPNGSGAKGRPIVIDRYGEGADPVVAGRGKVENTIRLHNQRYWEIRNLTITNTDGGGWDDLGRTIRRAVYVTAEDVGDVQHIHLKNLTIRDVRGMYRFAGHLTNGGIICQVTGKSKKTRFVDLRIENCIFRTKSIDRYPVVVTSSWRKDPACEVVWKNNTLDHAGRAHIVIPADQWPRKLVYYFDPEVRKVFPLKKTAPPVSPLTGRVGCEDIFSEMAARLKRSWSFFEATRVEPESWLFKHSPGDKEYSLWSTAAMTLGYYGELRALGFEPPWIENEDKVMDAWISEIKKLLDPKTNLLKGPGTGAPRKDAGYLSHGYNWQMQNRVFMADRYTLPAGAMHGGGDPIPTKEAAIKSFQNKNWGNPYSSSNRMGYEMASHQQVLRDAGKPTIDETLRSLRPLFDGLFKDGYWGRPDPNGNMKTLVVYSRMDWPIPDHKKVIDFTLSRATDKAGFEGGGCSSFNQMFSLTEARRQFPDGYRGEEIDKYTAMTFITFLNNWNEKLNFYDNNWSGKHNNGVPLYMPHLMLDLPIMRASTVYNWREGPIITRGKDGSIRRNKVTYQTKSFPFGG